MVSVAVPAFDRKVNSYVTNEVRSLLQQGTYSCCPLTVLSYLVGVMASVQTNDDYPLSYRFPIQERYGSTLLPATREQHD